MALPTRLTKICRNLPGSPSDRFRHVGHYVAEELEPLLVGAKRQRLQGRFHAVAQFEIQRVQVDLSGFDLGEVEDAVDYD